MSSWKEVTSEELRELYRTRSCLEIAGMFGLAGDEAVRKKLKKFGIDRRPVGGRREFDPPADELRELYQRHSMREISKIYAVGETVVWKRLKQHGIKLRDWEDGGHRKKPGHQFSTEHKANIRRALAGKFRGKLNPRWQGGATVKHFALRTSPEYVEWRKAVLRNAGDACAECGAKKGTVCNHCGHKVTMHVHHIKSFSKYPKLRFDPSNGRVICSTCHAKEHGWKSV